MDSQGEYKPCRSQNIEDKEEAKFLIAEALERSNSQEKPK